MKMLFFIIAICFATVVSAQNKYVLDSMSGNQDYKNSPQLRERIKWFEVFPARYVWRAMSFSDKENKDLLAIINTDGGTLTIIEIIFSHVLNKEAYAYYKPDDTTIMPIAQIARYKKITDTGILNKVSDLLIYEKWTYNGKEMDNEILALAPAILRENNKYKPLFWVKYPEMKAKVKKYRVGDRGSFTNFFERRLFASTLINITY